MAFNSQPLRKCVKFYYSLTLFCDVSVKSTVISNKLKLRKKASNYMWEKENICIALLTSFDIKCLKNITY